MHGIELSQAMVDQLRAKPGGRELPVTIGDMATARADGEFSLVYLVFNTIVNLTTQAAQVACFANAAAHLLSGGCFVLVATTGSRVLLRPLPIAVHRGGRGSGLIAPPPITRTGA